VPPSRTRQRDSIDSHMWLPVSRPSAHANDGCGGHSVWPSSLLVAV
jgi:hypothetical protein